jgi:hypothetical protein
LPQQLELSAFGSSNHKSNQSQHGCNRGMSLPAANLISAASHVFSLSSSSFATSSIAALVHGAPGSGNISALLLLRMPNFHPSPGKSTLVAHVAKEMGVALRRIDCFTFASDIPVISSRQILRSSFSSASASASSGRV